eukprot:11169244-Lingulodinium_polyedra.AAC.1
MWRLPLAEPAAQNRQTTARQAGWSSTPLGWEAPGSATLPQQAGCRGSVGHPTPGDGLAGGAARLSSSSARRSSNGSNSSTISGSSSDSSSDSS